MAIYTKVSGASKSVTDAKVKVGGAWKQVNSIHTKVNGVWKEVWANNIIVSNFSLTSSKSYELYDRKYKKVTDIIKIVNLVVKCYNGSTLVDTHSFGDDEISSVSYNLGNHGSVGITTYPNTNTIQFSVSIDYDKTDARKVVITADRIEMVE